MLPVSSPSSFSSPALALTALLAEAVFSYPAMLFETIRHPVSWMAALLTALETRLNRPQDNAARQKTLGVVTILVLTGVSGLAAALLRAILPNNFPGLLLAGLAGSSLIAQRSLYAHVRAVALALEPPPPGGFRRHGLDVARAEVAKIVGRNPQNLDESGIARAAIESLAENFSDGVVAPLFWMALCGLPGAAIYKAANTADSMIGHRNARYQNFGWAAARLDDLLNLPASRIAAVLLIAAAPLAGGSPRNGWRAMLRDAPNHRSPNAGWPEAAMAGALGQKLGGPRAYGDELVQGAFMGDGNYNLKAADIRRALGHYTAACILQAIILLGLCLIVPG